jgi:hypothetical protein
MTNFLKVRPLGADLFRAGRRAAGRTDGQQTDRQTDRHEEANSRFWNFGKAPSQRSCLCPIVELKYLTKRQARYQI